MEDFKKNVCRLCVKFVVDDKFKLIEEITKGILGVLVLNLNLEQKKENVICDTCYVKLMDSFNFKSACLDVEDNIASQVNSELPVVDLKDIYVKEEGHQQFFDPPDKEICRLCMRLAKEFTTVHESDKEMIHKYMPEINFGATKDPVICSICWQSLETLGSFLQDCSHIKKEQESSCGDVPNESLTETTEVTIKTENDDIKFEVNEQQHGLPASLCQSSYQDVKRLDSVDNVMGIHECNPCKFETKVRSTLEQHDLTVHKKISKVKNYACNSCDFETFRKHQFTFHMLIHKNPSRKTYKCDKCNYKSNRRSTLLSHRLKHDKPPSEFKCDKCNFVTSWKCSLPSHLLTHKVLFEEKLYKCNKCDYQTKYQHQYKDHTLSHRDTEIYSCEQCEYKTNQKRYLRVHGLRHKDRTQVEMHKCDVCPYETKYKYYLSTHKLRHKDGSDVVMYKCEVCGYQTKNRHTFKVHRSLHKDESEKEVVVLKGGTSAVRRNIFSLEKTKRVKDILSQILQQNHGK